MRCHGSVPARAKTRRCQRRGACNMPATFSRRSFCHTLASARTAKRKRQAKAERERKRKEEKSRCTAAETGVACVADLSTQNKTKQPCDIIMFSCLFLCASHCRAQAFFLGYMVHRTLQAALRRRQLDDRDHYGNKRLDMAGPLTGFLFRTLFRKVTKEVGAT